MTAAPDDRPSTVVLRDVVDELARRPSVEVATWFLRATPEQSPWPGAWVVDELRRDPLASTLDRFALPRIPAAVRGARLRGRVAAVAPDVLVLDDGLGARVLAPSRLADLVVVDRQNPEPSPAAAMEPRPTHHVDVVIGEGGAVAWRPVRDHRHSREVAGDAARADTRRRLGVPVDVPLVVGWGTDGWLDGPDLFLRSLWAVGARHGMAVHGLWLDAVADDDQRSRLAAEAVRCGLADRVHQPPLDDLAARACGDVVLLPGRCPVDPFDVHVAVAGGVRVVAFDAVGVDDPAVRRVADLDTDAAAVAVAGELGSQANRAELMASARDRLDVAVHVDELLAAIDAAGGS